MNEKEHYKSGNRRRTRNIHHPDEPEQSRINLMQDFGRSIIRDVDVTVTNNNGDIIGGDYYNSNI